MPQHWLRIASVLLSTKIFRKNDPTNFYMKKVSSLSDIFADSAVFFNCSVQKIFRRNNPTTFIILHIILIAIFYMQNSSNDSAVSITDSVLLMFLKTSLSLNSSWLNIRVLLQLSIQLVKCPLNLQNLVKHSQKLH